MYVYSMSQEQMEESADGVKTAIIEALEREGKFTEVEADEWCQTHTVVFRKKNIFQTISNLWKKASASDGFYIIVVKKV